jgi:cytochrome P450
VNRTAGVGTHRDLAELPVFTEIDAPDFGLDFAGLSDDLFSRAYQGLMRTSDGGYTDGSVFVYRNADLKDLVSHADLGNQPVETYVCPYIPHSEVQPPGFHELMVNSIFTMHPPAHGPARQLVARRLTRSSVERFREPMRRVVRDALHEAAGRDRVDFRRAVADRVMVGFWRVALGWTEAESREICELASASQLSNLLNPSPEQRREVNHASGELIRRLDHALQRELAAGNHVLLTELAADYVAMEPGAPGRPRALQALVGASLLDGLHSLGAVIANVVLTLLDAPEALAAVRADQTLIGAAFSEGVRLNPTVTLTQRHALRDLTIDDIEVPEGTPVTMAWLLGNRDPDAFPEPNTFRLDRAQRAQTTFGGGFYICPGRNLVRFLTETVLEQLTSPTLDIAAAGPAEWIPVTGLHELRSMPVKIRHLARPR